MMRLGKELKIMNDDRLKTPMYCIVGLRPVKALSNDDSFGIYVFNWQTGEFDLDLSYIERIYFGSMDEVEFVTEDEFEKYVEKLRSERGFS